MDSSIAMAHALGQSMGCAPALLLTPYHTTADATAVLARAMYHTTVPFLVRVACAPLRPTTLHMHLAASRDTNHSRCTCRTGRVVAVPVVAHAMAMALHEALARPLALAMGCATAHLRASAQTTAESFVLVRAIFAPVRAIVAPVLHCFAHVLHTLQRVVQILPVLPCVVHVQREAHTRHNHLAVLRDSEYRGSPRVGRIDCNLGPRTGAQAWVAQSPGPARCPAAQEEGTRPTWASR